jgi:hypothetical protein
MVILITTTSAYIEMKDLILSGKHSIWFSEGVLKSGDIDILREKNIDVSAFNYQIDSTKMEDIECGLSTIKEHHPNQGVWVQLDYEIGK